MNTNNPILQDMYEISQIAIDNPKFDVNGYKNGLVNTFVWRGYCLSWNAKVLCNKFWDAL